MQSMSVCSTEWHPVLVLIIHLLLLRIHKYIPYAWIKIVKKVSFGYIGLFNGAAV